MVKIYSTPVCPYCHTLKAFLKNEGVSYEDVDVSKDKNALEEMIQKTGRAEVPIVDIDGEIVIGFDKERICQLLGIKK